MKKKIYRLNWDSGVLDEITNWLRCRELSQEFIYFWNGSKNYLNYVSNSFLKWGTINEKSIDLNPWENILKKYSNWKDIIKNIYIWVACGDSKREIEFIKSLWKNNILYIWVDLSSEMIERSEYNLDKENFDYVLIQADIFNSDLLNQINLITKESDIKSFIFLWWTFWNFRTTNITDLLGGYMKKWEKLYIDIPVKWELSEDDFKLHEYYLDKSKKSEKWLKYINSWFIYIDFPLDKWDIVIQTSKDAQVGLFWIYHLLRLKENIEFLLNNKVVIFSKWEEINFFSITYYESEKLINFMKIHHFNLFDKDLDNWVLGQFLFEKQ